MRITDVEWKVRIGGGRTVRGAGESPGHWEWSDLVVERRCAPGLRPTEPRESRGKEKTVMFPIYRGELSSLTTEQMTEVDRAVFRRHAVSWP